MNNFKIENENVIQMIKKLIREEVNDILKDQNQIKIPDIDPNLIAASSNDLLTAQTGKKTNKIRKEFRVL